MYSWQGLAIMFLFGSLVATTVITFWFMYSELRLHRANEQYKNAREEEIKDQIRKKLLGDEDE